MSDFIVLADLTLPESPFLSSLLFQHIQILEDQSHYVINMICKTGKQLEVSIHVMFFMRIVALQTKPTFTVILQDFSTQH